MVMLHAIHALKLYNIVVCHMNHLLRPESKDDADFVKETVLRLGLKFEMAEDDVSAYAKLKGKSIEESARDIRYSFLHNMRKHHDASYILTAHNLDDNAETILLHLIRGAGPNGMKGIAHVDKKNRLLRPMLAVSKEAIREFATANSIRNVEDATNLDSAYSRNRVRNEIMPQMKKINTGVNESLTRFGAIMSDVENYMRSQAMQWLEKNGEGFELAAFRDVHPAVRREIVKICYLNTHGHLNGFTAAMCEEVVQLFVRAITNKKVYFGDGYEAVTQYGNAHFGKTEEKEEKEEVERRRDYLRERSKNFRFELASIEQFEGIFGANPFEAYLDYDKLRDKKLFIRYRKKGDTFCPSGMEGKTKKLQDFFVDKKIDSQLRDEIPLLVTDNDEIVWVVGIRVDERFKIEEKTSRILKVNYLGDTGKIN